MSQVKAVAYETYIWFILLGALAVLVASVFLGVMDVSETPDDDAMVQRQIEKLQDAVIGNQQALQDVAREVSK